MNILFWRESLSSRHGHAHAHHKRHHRDLPAGSPRRPWRLRLAPGEGVQTLTRRLARHGRPAGACPDARRPAPRHGPPTRPGVTQPVADRDPRLERRRLGLSRPRGARPQTGSRTDRSSASRTKPAAETVLRFGQIMTMGGLGVGLSLRLQGNRIFRQLVLPRVSRRWRTLVAWECKTKDENVPRERLAAFLDCKDEKPHPKESHSVDERRHARRKP